MQTVNEIYQAHKSPTSRIKPKTDQQLWEDAQKPQKRSKMGNKWIVIDNINFQSQGEGYYYLELKDRCNRGEFQGFKRQIPFEFYVDGVRVGKYVADFGLLHHDGSVEVIDYKSRFTVGLALYQMKKALMMACYKVAIKEVGKD